MCVALPLRDPCLAAAVVHPMNEALGEVPVANPGAAAIIRCKRCRTYMNPFMAWTDGGRCAPRVCGAACGRDLLQPG